MNRIARNSYGKGFFHIMVQGINKKYIFEKSIEKEEYLSLLLRYKNKFQIMLLAYCIMDNHAHMLIYTDEIYEMSKYMRIVNSRFARDYNKVFGRVGYVFRDRYNSQYIDTQEYLLKCLNYIHMNPVTAKMVEKPEDYRYSSYKSYTKEDNNIDDKAIEKVFNNKKDYLKILKNIPYEEIEVMDIDREEENFMIAVKNYLLNQNTSIERIKNSQSKLHNFCKYLVTEKKYKQIQVSKLLQIDIKKVYYLLKKSKKSKISPS